MKSLGLFLVLGASGLWAYAGSGHAVDPLADENAVVRADGARIAAHLQRVEIRLRGADVSNLTPAQQERRAQALDRLRDYRQNQIFPHNHDFSNQRVPYFEDEHGTLCAMAYLIAESGRRDIVDQHRRRGAEHGDVLVADELVDERRFHFAQADIRHAAGSVDPGEGPPVGVKHRQGPQIPVARR